ncbi:SDR family oxidoreductase [Pelagibacterales bacterium]|nr:SDR family oxidoreductase [Pelagibacterales bacterium]
MRILITGGSGYLGGRIAKYLAYNKYDVTLVSRKGNLTNNVVDNVKKLCIDWNSSEGVQKICNEIDVIIHCAGMSAMESKKNPLLALKVKKELTGKIVESTNNSRVKKIIYLSSCHVYHENLEGTFLETSDTLNTHPYAIAHRAAEDILLKCNNKEDVSIFILRLSNIVGAPLNKDVNCWSLIANDLCRQIISNKKIVIKNNPAEMRDFVSMSNLCIAIEKIIQSKKFRQGIYNFSSNKSLTILEIAEKIQSRCLHILKFSPDIIIKTEETKKLPLLIENKKISRHIHKIDSIIDDEIDELLTFCHENQQHIPS